MILVADTHTMVWLLEASKELSPVAKNALADDTATVVLPTIALAEISFLYAKRRIAVEIRQVLQFIQTSERFRVHPLDSVVALMMPTSLDIHDAIICGTALVYQDMLGERVTVVTRDQEIRDSGLVATVW